MERCENCGGSIGELQSAHVWNERTVCAPCRRTLEAEQLPAMREAAREPRKHQPAVPIQINVVPPPQSPSYPVYVPVQAPRGGVGLTIAGVLITIAGVAAIFLFWPIAMLLLPVGLIFLIVGLCVS